VGLLGAIVPTYCAKMTSMRIQAPRGTEDLLPSDSHKWRFLEQAFFNLASLYGYREIRTPMFEDIELFKRTSGETSDIVSKEMYDFFDKGGRHVCLRPEGTAPVMRAAIEHGLLNLGIPLRMSYGIPFFRYGRPQKGRLRQAHQFGLELIGSKSPEADAEIIEIVANFYETIGIGKVRILVNSIGRSECRNRYREVVLDHFARYLRDVPDEERAKAAQNPLRLLDSKDPKAAELKATVPSILNYLEDEASQNFELLQALLSESQIDFQVAPDIVRGLDYYTDTVFEVVSDRLGAQSSLCGGGRYDRLIEELGGPPTPSVGVGMGIERAVMVLESMQTEFPIAFPSVYVVQATEDAAAACRKLALDLRRSGLEVQRDLDGRKLPAQLKHANKIGARFAAIIGTDELSSNAVTVRNLTSGEQAAIRFDEIGGWIKDRL
jgi:histidyl-tRNA synthetase